MHPVVNKGRRCKMQTVDCRLQTVVKMHIEGKMKTVGGKKKADCRLKTFYVFIVSFPLSSANRKQGYF